MKVQDIPIKQIRIVENVRVASDKLQSFMESIKQHGLLEPIGVGKIKDKEEYIVMYGHRRFIAYVKLGYKTIPAVVIEEPSLKDLLIIGVSENLQRKDISPSELGRICHRLYEEGMTLGEMAARLSIPISKLKTAFAIYGHIPKRLRDQIVFKVENRGARDGKLAASATHAILQLRSRYSFPYKKMHELMESARKEELSLEDLKVIGGLLAENYSVSEAIKEGRKYKVFRVDVVVKKEIVEKLIKKHNFSAVQIFKKIIVGEIPPIKITQE